MTDITKTHHGLARKAIAQETHRFDDLYQLLYKREWTEAALQHVLSNDGAVTAGVDGISWRDFYDVEKSDFERDRWRRAVH
jgi:RNA-directed DNA polymerase